MHCWKARSVITGLGYGNAVGRSTAPRPPRLQVSLPLPLRRLVQRALLKPRQAVHAVGGDLRQDLVDPELLGLFFLRALLCPRGGPLAEAALAAAGAGGGVGAVNAGGVVDAVLLLKPPRALGTQ